MTNKCAEKIKSKLNLSQLPGISVETREYEKCEDGWSFDLNPHGGGIIESAELFAHDSLFTGGEIINPIDSFKDEYPELFFNSDKNLGYRSFIQEVIVDINSNLISAGLNWLIVGQYFDNKVTQKFCAIIYVHVRGLFANCSVASLLKNEEIQFAIKQKVDFIQTWHSKQNINFISAIIPSLKNDFIFHHGSPQGGESYEDHTEEGFVHLRKYINNPNICTKVTLQNGKTLISPTQNSKVIDELLKKTNRLKYKGKMIESIGKSYTKKGQQDGCT